MNLPTGRRGRLLALALLLLPLALVVRVAVLPAWQAYADQGERIASARDQLQRYQRLAAQLPALRDQHTQLHELQVLTPYLIQAPNSALAAASVQQRLQEIAQVHAGRILSTRVLQGTPDGPFERVVVNARLQIPLEGLQAMLYELETSQPYLFLEDISVMSRTIRRSRSITTATSSQLETRLTVYGLRRAAAEGAERG